MKGKVVQVIGPVLDVEFSGGKLPKINEALTIKGDVDSGSTKVKINLTLEVAAHLGDNAVRAVALGPTDGISRGLEVEATGGPIMVPVGKACLGRLMDVLGEPKDKRGPIKADDKFPIHRGAPTRVERPPQRTPIPVRRKGKGRLSSRTDLPAAGNHAILFPAGSCMVTVAQLAECLTVDQVVAGSNPVGHPPEDPEWQAKRLPLFLFPCSCGFRSLRILAP